MDKYIEKLNPADLIGEKFSHQLGGTYTILMADKTDKYLRVFMVDLDYATIDRRHKKAFNGLKKHLTEDNFMDDISNIEELEILTYSYVKINCSLLRLTYLEDMDASFIVSYSNPRNNFDLEGKDFRTHVREGYAIDNITSIKDIHRELSQKNLRNGLRHVIAKHLGTMSKDYRKDIKNFYYNYLKQQLVEAKQELTEQLMNVDRQLSQVNENLGISNNSHEKVDDEKDYPTYNDGSSIY